MRNPLLQTSLLTDLICTQSNVLNSSLRNFGNSEYLGIVRHPIALGTHRFDVEHSRATALPPTAAAPRRGRGHRDHVLAVTTLSETAVRRFDTSLISP